MHYRCGRSAYVAFWSISPAYYSRPIVTGQNKSLINVRYYYLMTARAPLGRRRAGHTEGNGTNAGNRCLGCGRLPCRRRAPVRRTASFDVSPIQARARAVPVRRLRHAGGDHSHVRRLEAALLVARPGPRRPGDDPLLPRQRRQHRRPRFQGAPLSRRGLWRAAGRLPL